MIPQEKSCAAKISQMGRIIKRLQQTLAHHEEEEEELGMAGPNTSASCALKVQKLQYVIDKIKKKIMNNALAKAGVLSAVKKNMDAMHKQPVIHPKPMYDPNDHPGKPFGEEMERLQGLA